MMISFMSLQQTDETTSLIRMTIEIGVAMLVGVYYVGALIDKIHKIVNNR